MDTKMQARYSAEFDMVLTKDDSELPLRVSYLKLEATKIHRAFTTPAIWDPVTDDLVPPRSSSKPSLGGNVDLKDLQDAINEYQDTQSESGNDALKLDPANCGWDRVFKQMDDVKARYIERDNGAIGKLRKLWRSAGTHSESIDPWLDFIPDEYGLNIVRTGIVVILQFAKRSAENHQRIIDSIVNVMSAVTVARPKRDNVPWDEDLSSCVRKLYVAVIEATSTIIQYLLQTVEKVKLAEKAANAANKAANKLGNIFNRDSKTRPDPAPRRPIKRTLQHIDLAVQNVGLKSDDFIELYNNTIDRFIVSSHTMQTRQQEVMRRIGQGVGFNLLTSSRIENRVNTDLPVLRAQGQQLVQASRTQAVQSLQTYEKLDTVQRNISDVTDIVEAGNKRTQEEVDALKETVELTLPQIEAIIEKKMDSFGLGALKMLNDSLKSQEKKIAAQIDRQAHGGTARQNRPRSQTRHQPSISFSQLAEALAVPPDLTQRDLDYLLGEQELFDRDQELAQATGQLLETYQFQNWFLGERSCLLLADGHDEANATESISAMTLLCVSILGSLMGKARRDPRVLVLYFFCGMHADADEGPRLMIRSLIMQLVVALQSRPSLNVTSLTTANTDARYLLWDLHNADLAALFHVLSTLLRQLPRYVTVYSVLDGVAWYENPAYGFCDAMVAVVDRMRGLAWPRQAADAYHVHHPDADGSLACCFKVLLTSANGTDVVHSRLSGPAQHVSVGMEVWRDPELEEGAVAW